MSFPVTFQVKNQSTSVTLNLYPDPWNPIGVSGVPAPSTPPLTIAPGGTGNFAAQGYGAFVNYDLSGPAGSYPKLRIRWIGTAYGVPLPGGPKGEWLSSPAPSDVYFEDTNSFTDHILYLKDTTPSKIKRGLLKAGTLAPADEVAAIKRAETEFKRRQVDESVNQRREAQPLGRSGRV